jgi:hypothetical protein
MPVLNGPNGPVPIPDSDWAGAREKNNPAATYSVWLEPVSSAFDPSHPDKGAGRGGVLQPG